MNLLRTEFAPSFYYVGGTLDCDAPSYVARKADERLFEGLLRGEFCHVLTARQMGKSSLMNRTVARLRAAGVAVAALDPTGIGQNLSAEQWYVGLLLQLGERLDLEDELLDFWQDNARFGPLQRWMKALREIVLPRYSQAPGGKLVIFIDEIDAVRSLPFSTDEFFASIRECYNQRSAEPDLARLTFCLLGVVTPAELIRDPRTTPFNIGQHIELHDFTEAEAAALTQGLKCSGPVAADLLKRIHYWTNGHPYLTQRLCQAVAAMSPPSAFGAPHSVDRLCKELFVTPRARERDSNLVFVREELLRDATDAAGLLDLYRQVVRRRRVRDDETHPLVGALRLSGIVRAEAGRLVVRNRIYAQAFDRAWIVANLPDAEWRRQRAAYWRGVVRTAALSGLVLVLVGWLALAALTQRNRATQQAEANRRLLYQAQLKLAAQEWENSNVARVEELLRATTPQAGEADLRGFEWYLFQALTHGEVWRLPADYPIEAAAFSPDGRQLAVSQSVRAIVGGDNEHLFKLYDLTTKQELCALRLPAGQSFGKVCFTADARRAVVIGPGGAAILCDLQTGARLTEFKGHTDELTTLALSPDDRWLLTADFNKQLKLWDVSTGQERATLHPGVLASQAAFSPDGRLLVVVDESRAVRVWETATGRALPPFQTTAERLGMAAFFPDGEHLLTTTPEGALQKWDANTRRQLATWPGHAGPVRAVAFAQNGKTLATGGDDRAVRLWSSSTDWRQSQWLIKGHGSAITALALSADGKYLLTGGNDKALKLWDVSAPQSPQPANVGSWLATAFNTERQLLAAGLTQDDALALWNLSTGQTLTLLDQPNERLLCAVFSPDQTLLATGGTGKTVKLWDTATGQLLKTLSGHPGSVLGLAFAPDGRELLAGSEPHELKLWDVATGCDLAALDAGVDNSYRAAFAPDGRQLATACRDGSIKLWRLPDRQVTATLSKHAGRIRGMAFAPDSRLLATGGDDNVVKLWDVMSGRELRSLGADAVQRLAFTADGQRLITGGGDGAVKLWDVATGQELITLDGHKGEVTSLTFSADGLSLVTSGLDGTLRWWRAAAQPAMSQPGLVGR